jgi:D-alanyl-D-alanine carboxypeptidase/D-alanyl-D-alanine-endopeptidase (penicillin-binding protein 4)
VTPRPFDGLTVAPSNVEGRLRSGQALALVILCGVLSAGLPAQSQTAALKTDLDRIFADPVIARALVGVRVESLRDGELLYSMNDDKLVMPASNMKIVTMAVAAERLGWDFRYETRLDATGAVSADGTLNGDLVVVGGGDPSMGSAESGQSAPFAEWAAALSAAGIRRVDGRLIGDDNAFEDDGLGAGWAWDYLGAGYAAPSGALSYNENAVTLRIRPGRAAGDLASIEVTPTGHGLDIVNQVRTGAPDSTASVDAARLPHQTQVILEGTVPAGGATVTQSVAVDNPTRFFVEALRLALAARGIAVRSGAIDIDQVFFDSAQARRVIARHRSLPLSSLGAYFMKASQNFYAETILKTLSLAAGGIGTAEAGKKIVRETLASWGVPADAVVVYDGSGLSRYNYVTAGAIVQILKQMWGNERFRGAFAASMPVAGRDGTLQSRMRGTALDARLEAKTGTISNVRALSGYLETQSGERLVFSMIANHFTAPTSQIDAVVEKALTRLAQR